jgi:hypothetical protein
LVTESCIQPGRHCHAPYFLLCCGLLAERYSLRGFAPQHDELMAKDKGVSASNAARGRNSPIKAHQINLQSSLIGRIINRFASAGRLLWICGRDS